MVVFQLRYGDLMMFLTEFSWVLWVFRNCFFDDSFWGFSGV